MTGALKPSVRPIPEGFHTITPYLVVEGAPKLIQFLKQAFGAQEQFRLPRPDGGVMHAELKIGDSILMMGTPMGEGKAKPYSLYLYVEDVDAVYQRAIQAGGTFRLEPRPDQAFFGYALGQQSWKQFLWPPHQTLYQAHALTETIENKIKELLPAADVIVHPEPLSAAVKVRAVPASALSPGVLGKSMSGPYTVSARKVST